MTHRDPAVPGARTGFWAVLTFLVAGSVWAQEPRGFVEGQVVNDATSRGLAGVALVVTDEGTEIVGRGLTQQGGVYVLAVPPGGPYAVTANSMGFQDATSDRFWITLGDTVRLPPLEMHPDRLGRVPDGLAPSPARYRPLHLVMALIQGRHH